MIVVDSSAILAIALAEVEAPHFSQVLAAEEYAFGWPTILETNMVLFGRSATMQSFITDFLAYQSARPVAFSQQHYAIAIHAFEKYGKGRHPAQLNFGDCMAYAVAVEMDAPLLFKSGDFARTDVKVHPASAV
ncbi:MAG: type II toxin-antitoxin system VapC family toxin [Parvularculaceae bacterium]